MDILATRASVSCLMAAALGFGALALGPVSGALGQTSQRWTGSNGGWWDSYINWFPGNEPTESTYTEFNQASTYTINFRMDGRAMGVQAEFGDVTFDMAGFTLNISGTGATDPGLQVGANPNDNARLTIRNGTVRAINAGIADDGNTVVNRPTGYLGVIGAGARLEVNGDFGVGHSGSGVLEVLGGGVAVTTSGAIDVGWEPGSNGLMRVAGAGSTLNARVVLVGQSGRARVLVDTGGTVTTTRGVAVPLYQAANGLVAVRGAGSRWSFTKENADSQVLIGSTGPGALAVLAGGVFASDAPVQVKPHGGLHGDGTVAGNVVNEGLVSPGGSYNDAANELSAAGIATLTMQGTFSQLATGMLAIDVGGTGGGQHDLLAVSGGATVAGTLRLTAVNGYVPAAGDSVVVLTASSIGGAFTTINGPALPAGLSYRVVYAPTQIVVTVGPTPPACPADVGSAGGFVGSDGRYNNNDCIAFVTLFFAGDARADFGRQGGVAGSDGLFDNNDFIAFINTFFAGCP